jgi:hypothetical protein
MNWKWRVAAVFMVSILVYYWILGIVNGVNHFIKWWDKL